LSHPLPKAGDAFKHKSMSSLIRALQRPFLSLSPIFRPPFDGMAVLVVLYFGWCFLVYPHSQTLSLNMPDPDDYMYLTQILDWITGQGWYDNSQYRLNPPEGVPIHFSRLAQAPMAAMIMLFHALGVGLRGAAMITALIFPLILLGGLLATFRFLATSFVPKEWVGITAFVSLFATGMMFMFMPGHVDHHNIIIILVALAMAFVLRMIKEPCAVQWGLAAGLTLALGQTIALEILPWLLLISLFVGFWATIQGGRAAHNAAAYGLGLYIASLLFLGITRPPAQWLEPDVLTYSITYIYLTGGIAVCFVTLCVVARTPLWSRLIVVATFAAITGSYFLHLFPEMISGPYGAIDPQLAEMILGEIDEAQPLIKNHPEFMGLLISTGGIWVALMANCFYFVRATTSSERWSWGFLLLLLLSCFGLTLFYQYRFMGVMGMLTVIPLTVLFYRGWQKIQITPITRRRFVAEIGLLLLVGPLPSVLLPALIDGRSFNSGVLLFPVDSSVKYVPCDMAQLERALNNPYSLGDHPRLIIGSMGQGPELLFRTPHKVLAAPFHMNVTGNVDALRFFSTTNPKEAETIARRRGVDLVVACRFVPKIFMRTTTPLTKLSVSVAGQDKTTLETAKPLLSGTTAVDSRNGAPAELAPHFIELLVSGKSLPWLKRLIFPALKNYLIFEVQPETSNTSAPQNRRNAE